MLVEGFCQEQNGTYQVQSKDANLSSEVYETLLKNGWWWYFGCGLLHNLLVLQCTAHWQVAYTRLERRKALWKFDWMFFCVPTITLRRFLLALPTKQFQLFFFCLFSTCRYSPQSALGQKAGRQLAGGYKAVVVNILGDLDYLAGTLNLPRWSRAVDCCALCLCSKEGEKTWEKLQQVCPLGCFDLVTFYLERVEPQEQMQDLRHSWTKCSQCQLRLDACKVFGKRPLCLRFCALPMDLSCGTWQWAGEPSSLWQLPEGLLQEQQDHKQV